MVGDHAMAGAKRPVARHAGRLGARRDQGAKRVGVVVVVHTLQDGGEAFQPHPRIDGRSGQVRAGAGRPFLVLHEHQVPDFDEPVAVLVGTARRAAGDAGAVVVKNLRARAAGAGIAHAPEIVGCGNTDDAVVRQAGHAAPQSGGILVLGIHGDQQPVARQGKITGQQVPGEFYGVGLEVIAEREIAEHLEKGVMARGVPDIIEVVVLAAGAHAFLGGGGAGVGPAFLTGEHVLELHHAGVGEQQGRIVARHQGGACQRLMAVGGEIVEESGAYVVAAGHGGE